MKKFELHPVDPAFTAAMEDAEQSAIDFSSQVMSAMNEAMERAIRTALVYVATDALHINAEGDKLTLLVNGRPAFEVHSNFLDLQVTVESQWLMWPLVADLGKARIRLSELEF